MPIRVMLAGLPGKMAKLVAEVITKQKDMYLHAYALSEEKHDMFIGSSRVILIPVCNHEEILRQWRTAIDMVVDFTQPESIDKNVEMYCRLGIPFVTGTTGGNREGMEKIVRGSEISAVIATNFSAPVAIFMEMIKMAADRFPGGLKGFKIFRCESHQGPDPARPDFKAKKDPSGTMIDLQPAFEKLIDGPVTSDQIIMLRDRRVQEFELRIPHENLDGHGFHTYIIRSDDGTVELRFEHNVLGRNTYIPLQAIRFLAAHMHEKGRVFSMIDVLQGK